MATILGLFKSVVVTLAYLRRNRVQAELAESYGVSQSTISRAIMSIIPLLGEALRDHVPTADELVTGTQYLVDGTLLPCWSWVSRPKLYAGKHKTTEMCVQVASDLYGNLAWYPTQSMGNRHDTYCLSESGALLTVEPNDWIVDKGYVGKGMITPIKKLAGHDLLEWDKDLVS